MAKETEREGDGFFRLTGRGRELFLWKAAVSMGILLVLLPIGRLRVVGLCLLIGAESLMCLLLKCPECQFRIFWNAFRKRLPIDAIRTCPTCGFDPTPVSMATPSTSQHRNPPDPTPVATAPTSTSPPQNPPDDWSPKIKYPGLEIDFDAVSVIEMRCFYVSRREMRWKRDSGYEFISWTDPESRGSHPRKSIGIPVGPLPTRKDIEFLITQVDMTNDVVISVINMLKRISGEYETQSEIESAESKATC